MERGRRLRLVGATIAILGLPLSLATCLHGEAQYTTPYDQELGQWQDTKYRHDWYSATQGSRLIPRSWLVALEQPDRTTPFLDRAHIESFGYLWRGPGLLPIGFAEDDGPDKALERTRLRWKSNQGDSEAWVGLTCSACHTSQIKYGDKTLRIDGGPALLSFQPFLRALNAALRNTRSDPAKWDRFSRSVLGTDAAADNARLKGEFDKLLAWQLAEERINQTTADYGLGRVDAFGRIYNKIALLLGGQGAQGNPPDAPVSIPFIWHAPRRSAVQYNGIAEKMMVGKTDIGGLGRNTGEVIGVFADVVPHANPAVLNGFASSVRAKSLVGLEATLAAMRPPAWPASVFGPLDAAKVEKGRALYQTRCLKCHELTGRDPNPDNVITVKMNALYPRPNAPLPAPGTDPWMACNAYDYKAKSGPLKGFKVKIDGEDVPIPETAPITVLLTATVTGVLLDKKGELAESVVDQLIGLPVRPIVQGPEEASALPEKEQRLQRCRDADPSGDGKHVGYTSRPLNGVWATAPFLHNGSVPTLYDLLLPAKDRPTSFSMGTRQYNPREVGFVTTPGGENTYEFTTIDAAGQPIYGNSNAGHDYGNAAFSPEDRYAIIEYLKSL